MRKYAGLFSVLVILLTVSGVAMAQRYGSRADAANAIMGLSAGVMILALIAAVFGIVVSWKIFEKAGQPGWASLIPIYNVVVMLRIAGKPEWWIILMLIPFVNLVVAIMALVATAERFGKSTGFAMGMLFLPIIFYPILAFGDATYQGSGTAWGRSSAPTSLSLPAGFPVPAHAGDDDGNVSQGFRTCSMPRYGPIFHQVRLPVLQLIPQPVQRSSNTVDTGHAAGKHLLQSVERGGAPG